MLIVKKFGGSSVANKERIFNVASAALRTIKQDMTLWSCFLPWGYDGQSDRNGKCHQS